MRFPGACIIGPSAVASRLVDGNAELINNVRTTSSKSNSLNAVNRSYFTRITDLKKGKYSCEAYPYTKLGLLGNLFLSEGGPGIVIKVTAGIRTGTDNFIHCLNSGLAADFEDPVAIGGTFLVKSGKVKAHIMPHFSKTPLNTDEDVNNWLNFFEMSAPLVHTSVFVSKDPGLDLRLEHSHFFSEHGDGGHYHYDTTPNTIEYVGYFNVAEFIYRIDQPVNTHQLGRD